MLILTLAKYVLEKLLFWLFEYFSMSFLASGIEIWTFISVTELSLIKYIKIGMTWICDATHHWLFNALLTAHCRVLPPLSWFITCLSILLVYSLIHTIRRHRIHGNRALVAAAAETLICHFENDSRLWHWLHFYWIFCFHYFDLSIYISS